MTDKSVSLEDLLARWGRVGDGLGDGREMARRLRALGEKHYEYGRTGQCGGCGSPWPCETRRILDGEVPRG